MKTYPQVHLFFVCIILPTCYSDRVFDGSVANSSKKGVLGFSSAKNKARKMIEIVIDAGGFLVYDRLIEI